MYIALKAILRHIPERDPDMAASSVDTLNNLSASSTWLSSANGARDILAKDSAIRTMASNCLHSE